MTYIERVFIYKKKDKYMKEGEIIVIITILTIFLEVLMNLEDKKYTSKLTVIIYK